MPLNRYRSFSISLNRYWSIALICYRSTDIAFSISLCCSYQYRSTEIDQSTSLYCSYQYRYTDIAQSISLYRFYQYRYTDIAQSISLYRFYHCRSTPLLVSCYLSVGIASSLNARTRKNSMASHVKGPSAITCFMHQVPKLKHRTASRIISCSPRAKSCRPHRCYLSLYRFRFNDAYRSSHQYLSIYLLVSIDMSIDIFLSISIDISSIYIYVYRHLYRCISAEIHLSIPGTSLSKSLCTSIEI